LSGAVSATRSNKTSLQIKVWMDIPTPTSTSTKICYPASPRLQRIICAHTIAGIIFHQVELDLLRTRTRLGEGHLFDAILYQRTIQIFMHVIKKGEKIMDTSATSAYVHALVFCTWTSSWANPAHAHGLVDRPGVDHEAGLFIRWLCHARRSFRSSRDNIFLNGIATGGRENVQHTKEAGIA
jgi:hypothetical protein